MCDVWQYVLCFRKSTQSNNWTIELIFLSTDKVGMLSSQFVQFSTIQNMAFYASNIAELGNVT